MKVGVKIDSFCTETSGGWRKASWGLEWWKLLTTVFTSKTNLHSYTKKKRLEHNDFYMSSFVTGISSESGTLLGQINSLSDAGRHLSTCLSWESLDVKKVLVMEKVWVMYHTHHYRNVSQPRAWSRKSRERLLLLRKFG